MTALLLTPDKCAAMIDAIAATYEARQLPPYWKPMPVPVLSGPHAGKLAIDFGPEALGMQMTTGLTLAELPDFQVILCGLGNPAPVQLDAADYTPPLNL
jgi:hypothetical protein